MLLACSDGSFVPTLQRDARLPANADDFRDAIREVRAFAVTLTPDISVMQDKVYATTIC